MNNYDEKIAIIKENQKKLLVMAKEKIEEEGNIFNLDTKNIIDVLHYDDKMIKKYQAVVEAQKLIQEYSEEIKNATSIEEIKEIRIKLNKCISKIKREMKNRGFDDIEINSYGEAANKFRKTISQKIRFIKREEKISEIELLNNNLDNLDKEDLKRLKRLVKNEINYENKYLENNDNLVLNKVDNRMMFTDIPKINKESSQELDFNFNMPIVEAKPTMEFETFDSLEDFVDTKVDFFRKSYSISQTEEYDGNIMKNISIFTRNLPTLVKNKKRVKKMIRDYNLFSRKPELLGYSKYLDRHNSLMYNFKESIKGKTLKGKEEMYENEHNKATEWIINFCKRNHLEIKYNKTMNA